VLSFKTSECSKAVAYSTKLDAKYFFFEIQSYLNVDVSVPQLCVYKLEVIFLNLAGAIEDKMNI